MRMNRRQMLGSVTGMVGSAWLGAGWPVKASAGSKTPPDPAPTFKLPVEGRFGETIALESLRGRVVLLNFWATWCVPCRREFPALDALSRNLGPTGLSVLAINSEESEQDALVAKFLREAKPSFPVLRDRDMSVARAYAIPGMPATFLVDRQGRMRWKHGGYSAGDENRYLKQANLLLQESG